MKLNPDKHIVELIQAGLKAKNGHCPCEVESTPENKCPCVAMREDNLCRCGLFVGEE